MSNTGDLIDLRLGRWQDVLADVGEVDSVIMDPPYGERTHAGNYAGCSAESTSTQWLEARGYDDKRARRKPISYEAWGEDDAAGFVRAMLPRCRSWFVVMTSHDLAPVYQAEFEGAGWYSFAPVPFVEPGKCPRMNGDGPASWSCWIMVARPRESRFAQWGSLPGAYIYPKGSVAQGRTVTGGKPIELMRSLIRDYTRPGDLVCDPCAGGATTLIAAAMEGRRAVGAEMDPETYKKAMARIRRGYTPDLFSGA